MPGGSSLRGCPCIGKAAQVQARVCECLCARGSWQHVCTVAAASASLPAICIRPLQILGKNHLLSQANGSVGGFRLPLGSIFQALRAAGTFRSEPWVSHQRKHQSKRLGPSLSSAGGISAQGELHPLSHQPRTVGAPYRVRDLLPGLPSSHHRVPGGSRMPVLWPGCCLPPRCQVL